MSAKIALRVVVELTRNRPEVTNALDAEMIVASGRHRQAAAAETRRLLDDCIGNSLGRAEADAFTRCAATSDMRERVRACVAERRPEFKGK